MPISFPGSRLREGIDMGLLFRSVGYSHRLHCHGCLCQFPHCFPSMDIHTGHSTLPLFSGIGLCSWLCIWLVIDQIMFHVFMFCATLVLLGVYGYYSFSFLKTMVLVTSTYGGIKIHWELLSGYSLETQSALCESNCTK